MRAVRNLILCFAMLLALFLMSSCGASSEKSSDGEKFEGSSYSLSEQVEYQGISIQVDPSWEMDKKEGICTWIVDHNHDVTLVLTTYKTAGHEFWGLEQAYRFLHLENREDSKNRYSSYNYWVPYEERLWIRFEDYDAKGTDEDGNKVTDCFLSGMNHSVYLKNGDGVSNAEFILELIGPRKYLDEREGRKFLKSLADTIEWDDSKTVLDSYELGYSKLSDD